AMIGYTATEEAPAAGSSAGASGGSANGGSDAEAERKLAATKAGEPKAVPGSATQNGGAKPAAGAPVMGTATAVSAPKNGTSLKSNGKSDNAKLLERAGVMQVDLNGGPLSMRAEQFASFQ